MYLVRYAHIILPSPSLCQPWSGLCYRPCPVPFVPLPVTHFIIQAIRVSNARRRMAISASIHNTAPPPYPILTPPRALWEPQWPKSVKCLAMIYLSHYLPVFHFVFRSAPCHHPGLRRLSAQAGPSRSPFSLALFCYQLVSGHAIWLLRATSPLLRRPSPSG
jgi:hypothetical protein